jgi:hypothetical protein
MMAVRKFRGKPHSSCYVYLRNIGNMLSNFHRLSGNQFKENNHIKIGLKKNSAYLPNISKYISNYQKMPFKKKFNILIFNPFLKHFFLQN